MLIAPAAPALGFAEAERFYLFILFISLSLIGGRGGREKKKLCLCRNFHWMFPVAACWKSTPGCY